MGALRGAAPRPPEGTRAAESGWQLGLVTVLPSPARCPCSLELSWESWEGRQGQLAGMRSGAGTGWERWEWGEGEELRPGKEEEKHAAASPSPVESEEKQADC